jgi:general secretion pathway protein G
VQQPVASRKTRRPRPTGGTPTGGTPSGGAGFTLVEILIVVVILGILAAIVVPQFVSAAAESRDSSIKMDLNRIRQQLEVYRQQHNGHFPTLADFPAQMTQPSDANGNTNAARTPDFPYGPYIREIPSNPRNALNTVTDGAVETSAWYYNESTGEFRANDSASTRKY